MPELPALTLTQPWATLMAINWKGAETRSWSTEYKGPLVIHAAKGFPAYARQALEDFRGRWPELRNEAFPLGVIVGRVELICCVPTGRLGEFCRVLRWKPPQGAEKEFAFGNYEAGRYAWLTRNPRKAIHQVSWKGALSLWKIPTEVLQFEGE